MVNLKSWAIVIFVQKQKPGILLSFDTDASLFRE